MTRCIPCFALFLLLAACSDDDSAIGSKGTFAERCLAHMQSINRQIHVSEEISITETQCSCMEDMAARLVAEGKIPSDDYGVLMKSKFESISVFDCGLKAHGREIPPD